MSYKQKIQEEIKRAVGDSQDDILVERTKLKGHGDVATNIAMVLAKENKKNPLEVANEIKEKIEIDPDLISHIDVAKPGFINFVVSEYALCESLNEVYKLEGSYGLTKEKSKEKVLVEYVSANPTGDLHIGHGRQAAIGSCLVNLLSASGYDTASEFYINDYGEQIEKLFDTSYAIYKKLKGEKIEWKEGYYPESILLPYIQKIIEKDKSDLTKESLGQAVKDVILQMQKELLSSIGVNFNKWFSETQLHKSGEVEKTLNSLKEKGCVYEQEGATWFRAKDFGDVRDRVLIRADGRPTYLLSDIAYHADKLKRSDHLITIWGADHHGQEIGLKGALKALGYDDNKLEIIFVQLVSLSQEGQEVKMSKRAGVVVTIGEVVKEVGIDAFRYFLGESHPNMRMVFDLNLAKRQDKDNPVYYVQYAHARCCSIFRQLTQEKISKEEKRIIPSIISKEELKGLNENFKSTPKSFVTSFQTGNIEYQTTKALILRILDFPEEVMQSAINRSPNRIANYLKDLATEFHQFYTVCRVISKDINLTKSRLGIVGATKITIANGLKLLGVSAPETM